MESLDQQSRRASTTLLRESTDWGVSVSEKRGRTDWLNVIFLVFSAFALFCGIMIARPLVIGIILSAEMTGIGSTIIVAVAFIGLAILFKDQFRKGRRNALELDRNANELRLGFKNRYGVFVRQQVIPLARVDDAFVQQNTQGHPELNFMVNAEQIQIALVDAKAERLSEIAAQICEAASRAKNAPRHSRVRSAIASIGASCREISNRAVSHIRH